MNEEFLSCFLPEGLLDIFEIVKLDKGTVLTVYLEEKNIAPFEYSAYKLSSKGFYEAITVQDFPVRDKACYFNIKRRRWLNEDTGLNVSRDWNLVAKGTRMTQGLADFLKGIDR